MSFYKELIDEGLACPIEVEKDEDGNYSDVTCYYSTQDMADQKFVIGRIEAWQAGGLADSIGEWGVTMWPWAAMLPVMAITQHSAIIIIQHSLIGAAA